MPNGFWVTVLVIFEQSLIDDTSHAVNTIEWF